ncbi:hypothetical protein [Methylobacterium sp. E-045]|nr:hypothetical protein [Methylobacterium sp. E-045]MCJ2130141.1 hypothetical protein [Methylobacterium sp. E-045]
MREILTATTSNALRWQLAALDVEAKLVRQAEGRSHACAPRDLQGPCP